MARSNNGHVQIQRKVRILVWIFLFVQPAVVAAQTATADSTFYSILDHGALTVTTIGGSGSPISGYARVQPGAGTTPPASFAVIDYRKNNVLISESSIAGVRSISLGRAYVEVSPGARVNTAMAFVNPNGIRVTVTFQLTDQNGNSTGPSNFSLNPGDQFASFLSEFPFNVNSFSGTVTFTATAPIAVTALRTVTNSRGDLLMANEPIVVLQSVSSTPLVLPHFADGAGWTSQVVLVNPTDQIITGSVQFFGEGSGDTPALPLSLVVNGQPSSSFDYSIPPRTAVKFLTSGTSLPLQTGSVRVTPSGGTTTPNAFNVLSLSSAGVIITQTVVTGDAPSSAFRMYAEANGNFSDVRSTQSAIAVANPSAAAVTVTFELWTTGGVNTNVNTSVTVPAFGHVALFFSNLFPTVALPFKGLIRASALTSPVAFAAFRARYNERREFLITSTPASNELAPIGPGDLVIPQIVDMGGYSTQFVLFSGTLNQSALGQLRFFSPVGQSVNVTFQ